MFISKNGFEELYEANYRAEKIGLYPAISFPVSFAELNQILPAEFSYSLDEDDGLGFRYCWYGVVGNEVFILTGLQNDYIQLHLGEKHESEKYQWTFLERLVDLPERLLQRVVWIRSDFTLKPTTQYEAKKSIFYKDRHGIIWEVYRAKSLTEADELFGFLQNLRSQIDYWIDEPEDLGNSWIICRILNGEEKIVGRYLGKSMTEDSARFMSLRDSAVYKVKEEKTGRHGLAFANGLIKNSAG
jgi:hypothetical protein